ncbi:egl nine homolog 1-like [Varroa jacobsoni]|uniref:egl nine homolog 1-like n=1 Tax=Varroa jacobsoni TaxID=62625 RepID=UPI000BF82326|nr:egl nine homolog 1-like [Varroa jacobsoni]
MAQVRKVMSSKGETRLEQQRSKTPQYCHLCGHQQNLKRCAACKNAWYCCKEHQVTHWAAHKHVCRSYQQQQPDPQQQKSVPHSPLTPPEETPSEISPPHGIQSQAASQQAQNVTEPFVGDAELQSLVDELCSSQNEWIDSFDFPQQQQQHLDQQQQSQLQGQQLFQQHQIHNPITQPGIDWLENVKKQVITDMNRFGVCVVNNFLGPVRANEIYEETVQLYQQKDLFHQGQVVNAAGNEGVLVRGDHIAWLDGSETYCSSIRFLIRSLDSVVARCRYQGESTGEFGQYRITQRTKAMLACYPGGGTRYYKHVDNPNFDGRRITCIYYINKGWNAQRDGGVLRIYPETDRTHVASVEPNLDRLVMFWSDRRNPHEVLPSERIRFALTVWYFDDNELEMPKCLNGGAPNPTSHSNRFQPLTPFTYDSAPTTIAPSIDPQQQRQI